MHYLPFLAISTYLRYIPIFPICIIYYFQQIRPLWQWFPLRWDWDFAKTSAIFNVRSLDKVLSKFATPTAMQVFLITIVHFALISHIFVLMQVSWFRAQFTEKDSPVSKIDFWLKIRSYRNSLNTRDVDLLHILSINIYFQGN